MEWALLAAMAAWSLAYARWPLPARCQAVEDAVAACGRAGLPPDCAWDGWHDCDRDDWTIRACLARGR